MVILKSGNHYLLLKRFKNPNKGLFTPIGGKLDPHESPRQAACRETFEETGIKLDRLTYCGTLVETSPTDYNWNSYVYRSEIEFRDPPECNEGVLQWIDRDRLDEIPTPVTDRHIYRLTAAGQPFMLHAGYDRELKLRSLSEEIRAEQLVKKEEE